MPYHQLIWPTAVAVVLWWGGPTTTIQHPATGMPEETAFLAESDAAMTSMMSGMTVKLSGDVDRDFVRMMIAHHQGAIDMARPELRYGRNEQLRRIAQEIIVDQLQEIAAMTMAIGGPLPPSVAAPTQTGSQSLPICGYDHSAPVFDSNVTQPDPARKP
jgi:hypothetical protein